MVVEFFRAPAVHSLAIACLSLGLVACNSTPDRDARFGVALNQGLQLQRIAPAYGPDAVDSDKSTSREMRDALNNHMMGKSASQPSLQAPLNGASAQ